MAENKDLDEILEEEARKLDELAHRLEEEEDRAREESRKILSMIQDEIDHRGTSQNYRYAVEIFTYPLPAQTISPSNQNIF
ncbi:MAG: hypothetical protein ACETWT_04080 [Thermodesulfobacteriota bacterium]